jgi:glyoxylase I family protein
VKVRMDHVAIVADNARELATFYREVVGLEPLVAPAAQSIDGDDYRWLKMGNQELHIMQRDDALDERLGVSINPIRLHFGFSIESTETRQELIEKLTGLGMKWMDWSPHGIPGKHQLFFVDPGGNLIEIQVSAPH